VALTHTDLDHIKYLDYLINSYEIDKIIILIDGGVNAKNNK